MEEETEVVAPEATEEVTDDLYTSEAEEEVEESVEEVRARLQKAEELANNYKIRAEKAEKLAKKPKETEAVAEFKGDLSSKDIIAITSAKLHEDDIDEVVNYAKYQGVSVSQALKSDVMKATLALKSEQRNVAEATNTGPARRGTAKASAETLLSNASQGKLPDSDADIERLLSAKMGYKS